MAIEGEGKRRTVAAWLVFVSSRASFPHIKGLDCFFKAHVLGIGFGNELWGILGQVTAGKV